MRSEINGITGTTKQDYYFRYYIPDDQYIGTFTFSSQQLIAGISYNYAVYVRLICFESTDQLNDLGTIPIGEYTTLFAGWIRTNEANEKTTIPINFIIDSPNKPTFYLVVTNANGYPITFRSHIFYYHRIYTATGNYIPKDHRGYLYYTALMTSTNVAGIYTLTMQMGFSEWLELTNIYLFTNGGVVDKNVTYSIGEDKRITHTVSDGDRIYLDSRFFNRLCTGPVDDIVITMTNFVSGDTLTVRVYGFVRSANLPDIIMSGAGTKSAETFIIY